MSDWKVIIPTGTINLHTNPSIEEDASGWTAGGTNTVAQSSTESKFGSYSLLCTYADDLLLADYSLTLTAVEHTFSVWVYIPSNYDGTQVSLRQEGFTASTGDTSVNADMTDTDAWQRIDLTFTPDAGDLAGFFRVRDTGAPTVGRFIYIDACQAEAQSTVTTYCDGELEGCEWNGAQHLSTSSRSALSRAGGTVQDLSDDYSFDISQMLGFGMAPVQQVVDEYAILPGGQVQGHKTQSRNFSLVGMIRGSSSTDLHAKRQALIEVFEPAGYPNSQPFILRYTGATVTKEIFAYYEAGLSGGLQAARCWNERFSLRFLSADPFWYEIGNQSDVLDHRDTDTFYYVTARLRSTGQWDDVGLSAGPTTGGSIYAILVASDGTVYIGGAFTGLNGVAGRDYIAAYTPSTDTWATVGAGSAVNGAVWAIEEAPNGDIYVGGAFTNVGDANGDYVAYYDVSGGAWASVSGGGTTLVRALAFGPDGTLYIAGTFTNWNAIAAADYIVTWDGSSYSAMAGTVLTGGVVYDVKVSNTGTVYIGGSFTNAGGDADADYIAYHDGSDWVSLNATPLDSWVETLAIDENTGTLYLGGNFSQAGSDTMAYIAQYNGAGFLPLGSGLSSVCQKLVVRNGTIWAGGLFSTAGGLAVDRLAKWNGSSWSHLDATFNVTGIRGMDLGPCDPVVSQNYDVWIGTDTSAAVTIAGTATVTNNGTTNTRPVFSIHRSGGSSATLYTIRNETTGKELLFDGYALLDDETLTIDLRLTKQSVMSDFFGSRPDAILKASDVGSFELIPGDNQITLYVDPNGGPTVTALCQHKQTFWSAD